LSLILAIDASAAHCAAALLWNDNCLTRVEPMTTGQTERLAPMIAGLLADVGQDWPALTALAVGTGPGNFTGTRIAVAFARGVALARGIPAIGITGFETIAEAAGRPLPFWAVIAATRGQVYAQRFGETPQAPVILEEAALATLDAPVIRQAMVGAAELIAATARAALPRLSSPQPRPAPLYLRGADAAPMRDPPPRIIG